ncbi:MAG: serine/threonine-protein kinase [Pirellula sp.]
MTFSVQAIFEQVCDLVGDARQAELLRLCGSGGRMRADVESLLKAHDAAGDFLDEPTLNPPELTETSLHSNNGERPGSVIGPYKLLEQIGEGGFGIVYMAQQSVPIQRRLALKILKPGMDTKQVVARFESERQALAVLDHPNIARVIDGGSTESGRPYFVMELVRGEPITKFCDQRKLSLRDRLRLFQDVCHAIEHAHQKGIIHRDIKPSNVLVTVANDKPLVKVIDFGIAKATNGSLTDKTLFTEFRQLLGTPLYMSPEQAEQSGVDVDTRSDIYSLGVLLYEVLTGRTPLDPMRLKSAAWAEIQRMIVEEEPSRPSVLVSSLAPQVTEAATKQLIEASRFSQSLRGDLDWIVLKAIDKDRTRRYPTASHFAADLDRYLHDQPVEATPPSRIYQFRKFARRNRGLLSALSVVFTSLFLGLIATGYAAKVAFDQKLRAEAGERQALRAATAAGASVLLPEADARRLAEGWQREIAAMHAQGASKEQDACQSEAQFTVWMSNWLMQHQLFDEADVLIEKVYSRCRTQLGTSDPTFFALCNVRILVNEARHGNPIRSADTYSDLIEAMKTIQGDQAIVSLLPEYAAVLARAGRDDESSAQIRRYLDLRATTFEPLSTLDRKRLQGSIDSLMNLGKIDPELVRQLQSIRETGTKTAAIPTLENDPELAADMQTFQGRWRHQFWKNGELVERMIVEFNGTTNTTQWVDEKDVVLRGRSGSFELSRSGGVKVITIFLGSSPTDGSSFIYSLSKNQFRIVSGMLANRQSLPEIELRNYFRIVTPNGK